MSSKRSETLLVTGAAGTVGSQVVALAESSGFRVVATDLQATRVRVPVRGEVRSADLRDASLLDDLVKGCDHVIHTAAQLDAGATYEELARTNTQATAALFEACRRAGTQRFVHMSTAMIYQPGFGRPCNEEAPIAPRGPHGMSKHAAETYLRGQGTDGPGWTILRAAPIYGRRGRHFASSLLAIGPILRLAFPVLPGLSDGPLCNMAHAQDVARALLFVLPRPETAGQVYNVASDAPVPLGVRVTETFRAYGLTTISVPGIPRHIGQRTGNWIQTSFPAVDMGILSAWKLVVLRHRLKPALRPRLDREAATLLHDDLVVDTTKLRSVGFEPQFADFGVAWREVLRWYQAERWVPRYS